MPRPDEIFRLEGAFVLKHSAKAILISYQGEDYWLPISQLHDYDELPQEGDAVVKMSAWIAKEKGFI